MNPLDSVTAFADTWWTGVLHSTWQSSLVVLFAFALVWLRRKRSASFLYAVLVVALLKFLVPPIISVPVLESPAAPPVVETATAVQLASSANAADPMMEAHREPQTAAPSVSPSAPAPAVQSTATSVPQPATIPSPQPVKHPAASSSVAAELPAPQPERAVQPRQTFNASAHWKALLALLHAAGIAALGLVMVASYLHLRKLLRTARPANDELTSLAKEVAAHVGLRRPVAVLLCSAPCAPMATGLLKRRILLPEALASLAPEEMRAILAHELAHHRRMDLAFIWVEHLVTLIWWFNPLVWVLVRAIHRKREDCCDDVVLSLGLAMDSQYCDTLLHVAKRLHKPFTPHLVFGCANPAAAGHPMGHRLTRIMDTAVRRRAALTAGGIVGVALMGLVLLPTFLPVAADTDAIAGSPATVPAKAEPGREWHHTGIVMSRGVEFELVAEGSILWDPNLPSVGPAGAGRTPNGSCGRPEEFPMPDAPCGGLVGRIGRGQPFFVGERTKVTGDGGYLFLTVNDRLDYFDDNEGAFIVTAAVDGSEDSKASTQPAAAGPSGKVLHFDGQNDYVLIPPATPLDLSETLSISAWVRVEPGCNDEAPVLRRGDARPGYDPYMFGIYRNRMHLGSFRNTSNNHDTAELVMADVDHDWHYWTGVRDADAGRLYLYRDGELVDDAPTGGPLQYSTESMGNEMGAVDQGKWSRGGNWGFFKGAIDRVSVWNVARKPEDILREMKQRIDPNEPGLVALWTFDEEGQTIRDSSPSGITGILGSSPEADDNDPARVSADAAPVQTAAESKSDTDPKIEEEIAAHYSQADPEVQDYIRWTASNFGRGGLWFAHDAFARLTPQEREEKIVRNAQVLDGEYGRSLCGSLAEAGALKDKRLLPGLIKAAAYHRDDSDYDCRPKWMAVAALGRQDDISAVPTLIPLVDHGNTNTRMWARASLVRLTGQNFNDDKQAWGRWWNESDNEPKIDLSQLKPWVPPGQDMASKPPAPPTATLQPAAVPPESQAVVDALPGELVFKGTYFHRSRGADLSAPSLVWLKETSEGDVIAAGYLPAFNDTSVAFLSRKDQPFRRYEGHYHGRDGRPPSKRILDLGNDTVTVTYEGGEKDGQVETLTVPPGALFVPNSRPDSYTAHLGFFQLSVPTETDPDEVPCYDWDNSGKGMAGYTSRFENAGKEEVTVPAGTFSANHIIETQLTFGDTWYKKRPGHITDYWVLDNGVVVRILRHREPYELQLLSVETPGALPGFLGKPEATPVGQLTILSAVYGARDSWVDLTEVLNNRIQNDMLEVRVSNKLGGDPIYGVEKTLNVHYRVGDKTYVTSVDELGTLRLPEGNSAPSGVSSTSSKSESGDVVVLDRNAVAEELASYDYADVVNTLEPRMAEDENGNVNGITSDNFASVPITKLIGLQNGDVVNTVNGITIDSDQKLMEVFKKFSNASTFRLGITRNGESMNLTFKLE